jgi:predicted ATP-dependent endonuclease of OLD family
MMSVTFHKTIKRSFINFICEENSNGVRFLVPQNVIKLTYNLYFKNLNRTSDSTIDPIQFIEIFAHSSIFFIF